MPTKDFSKSDLFFKDANGDYQKIISIEEFELPLEDIEPVDGFTYSDLFMYFFGNSCRKIRMQ